MTQPDNIHYLEDLKKTQDLLWDTLRDLTSIQKAATLQQIVAIEHDLIKLAHHPYFCRFCQQKHLSGKKYSAHLPHAEPILKFPRIRYPKLENELFTEIVGVYYAGSGELIKKLQKKENLALKIEPTNPYDSNAVSVWYQEMKLGYLPREQNKNIFNAIQSGKNVKCRLGRYLPKIQRFHHYFKGRRNHYWDYNEEDEENVFWDESTFRPERAEITIFIQEPLELTNLLENLVEMVDLGFPIVAQDFTEMGFETIKILESLCQTSTRPGYKQILSAVFSQFQVELDPEARLSIIL